ncbi:hypothetical protein MXB_454 [Myxobolus squamalis]|nr:hypothetical protein MXB_454 [Myxobolus squamalis]
MPKVQQVVKEFFRRDPSKSVNPDEAVAMGAAVQGGVLTGSVSDIVLVDVTPYSLGVKTLGDVYSAIIPKNTAIPTRKSEIYTTSEDNQTHVHVSVYQGERSMCADNVHLGDFALGPIPAKERGAVRIEVSFDLDSNGILKVTATDLESNIRANATLKSNPRGLSKEELEKMAKEAEKERQSDAVKKGIVVAKTTCESTLYDCRQFVTKFGDKLEPDVLSKFQAKIDDYFTNVVQSTGKDEKFYREKNNELIMDLSRVKNDLDSSKSNTQSTQTESSKTDTTSEHPNDQN